jgi:hypothetical protein
MAVVLWGSKTPGERERDRDRAVSNNKKKVLYVIKYYRRVGIN